MALDILSDGFIGLCFDSSLNWLGSGGSIIVEGQYVVNGALATPIVPDVPQKIQSVRNVDTMFTAGSVLAEALKKVFALCGTTAEVYAIPRQDAAAAVKAVYTITVAGPATSDGNIDLFLGDKQYSIAGLAVTSGDTANTIASAIAAAIPTSFPYDVTVATNVVTLTAKNGGTVGNFLNPVVNWKGLQNYFPAGVTLTVARTTAGSVNPAAIDYASALGTCCYDTYALLTDDRTWQEGLRAWIASAWDCTKPQCFGHGYTYNTGTLGQVLAADSNSAELSRVAVPLNDVNFPWAITVGYAALSACKTTSNPEFNVQGRTNGVLSAIYRPAECARPWTYDETVQLQESGFVTYGPLAQGQGTYTYPYIENDITNYRFDDLGRANVTWRDASSRRLAKYTAVQLATKANEFNGLSLYSKNTRIKEGVFGTNKKLITAKMHDWAQSQVGSLFSEFTDLNQQLVIKEDSEVQPACQGVPCKLRLYFQYSPPCRISRIDAVAQIKALSNCDRAA